MSAWINRGHPEGPHWQSLQPDNRYYTEEADAVWDGRGLLTWEYQPQNAQLTISRYDPRADHWTYQTERRAFAQWFYPGSGRPVYGAAGNRAVWGGGELMFFTECAVQRRLQGVGHRYDPASGQWRLISAQDAPGNRAGTQVFAEGNRMVVFGGSDCETGRPLDDGAIYDRTNDRWTPIPPPPDDPFHYGKGVALAQGNLIVWGGYQREFAGEHAFTSEGFRYDLIQKKWSAIPVEGVPARDRMRVWSSRPIIW
jgi:hypothetical protein